MFEFESGWIIRDHSFSYDSEIRKGSAYAMANGYMGHRGALEEAPSDGGRFADPKVRGDDPLIQKSGRFVGNYVAGIYDAHKGLLREREIVNIQNWASIKLWVDNEPLDLETGQILSFRRWMDLRDAILHRQTEWKSPSGKVVTLQTEHFVSMQDIHFGFDKWQLSAEDACDIRVEAGLDANVLNTQIYHFKDFMADQAEDFLYLETVTKEMEYHVGVACHDAVQVPSGLKLKTRTVQGNRKYIFNEYQAKIKQGQTFDLTRTASIYTSRDVHTGLKSQTVGKLREMVARGYARAKERHVKKWANLWEQADVQIEGDEQAQIGIRFSIYHLINSAPYHTSNASYTARSLSGQDHWGTIHWDTEIYIMPFFTHVFPDAARNMLIYRYKGLYGARKKAKDLGYRGAFYAWRSHEENGIERCPKFVNKFVDTGRYMRNYFMDKQIHIVADIAYALWQYYQATGDLDFLVKYGLEILLEISRFHESRVTYNKVKKHYMVKDVIGPDEYHATWHDNAYTNVLIQEAFANTFNALAVVKAHDPKAATAVMRKIEVTDDELEKWQDVRDRLFIPQPDEETLLIEQFRNYFKLEDCTIDEVLSRKKAPHEFIGGKHGIINPTQIIKQADVALLLYLMRDRYSEEVKRANFEYYEPRTEHGSSLSTMAYALVASDIGMMDWAYEYFLYAAQMDIGPQEKYFSGYYNHGIHPCSLGGAWLDIVHGFSGVTLKADGVHWREPHIPKLWNRLVFKLQWHGHVIVFNYKKGAFTATLDSTEKATIPFFINGRQELLTETNLITLQEIGAR